MQFHQASPRVSLKAPLGFSLWLFRVSNVPDCPTGLTLKKLSLGSSLGLRPLELKAALRLFPSLPQTLSGILCGLCLHSVCFLLFVFSVFLCLYCVYSV